MFRTRQNVSSESLMAKGNDHAEGFRHWAARGICSFRHSHGELQEGLKRRVEPYCVITINVMDSSRRILSRGSGLLACAFSIGVVPSAIPIHTTEPPRADEAKSLLTLLSPRMVGGRRD